MMFQSVSRAMASAGRINEVIDADPVISGGSVKEGNGKATIEFKNVSFRYPGTQGAPVLHDINLKIKQGETLAIIGATGCGKTSLVNLLPRFYDATEGTVLFDGVDVKEYDLTASDLLARAICHECDHLDGKLYTDVQIRKLTREDFK